MALTQIISSSRTAHSLRGLERDVLVSSKIQSTCPRTRRSCVVRVQKAPQEAIQEAVRSDRIPSGSANVRASGVDETLSDESIEVTERIGKVRLTVENEGTGPMPLPGRLLDAMEFRRE